MSSVLEQYLTQSFSSFSGCDIRATFAGDEIGTLQAISYAIQREKAPIYTMGDPNPRAFSRGKRGIAGTCIFVMFDSHSLMGAINEEFKKYVADKGELNPSVFQDSAAGDALKLDDDGKVDWEDWHLQTANYVDQIPPFDIVITAVNEVGGAAVCRIWHADILNEGWGISVDDQVSEMQTTYVCRAVTKWTRAGEDSSVPPFQHKVISSHPGTTFTKAVSEG